MAVTIEIPGWIFAALPFVVGCIVGRIVSRPKGNWDWGAGIAGLFVVGMGFFVSAAIYAFLIGRATG